MVFFTAKTKVLFICTANICRSPLAEAMMRHHVREAGLNRRIKVQSAGTRASMLGHRPDARAIRVAKEAGVSMAGIKARQLRVKDLADSDFILALDGANLADVLKICPQEHQHKVRSLMSFAPGSGPDQVPDPYYGNYAGFEEVSRLIESAIPGLLNSVSIQGETT